MKQTLLLPILFFTISVFAQKVDKHTITSNCKDSIIQLKKNVKSLTIKSESDLHFTLKAYYAESRYTELLSTELSTNVTYKLSKTRFHDLVINYCDSVCDVSFQLLVNDNFEAIKDSFEFIIDDYSEDETCRDTFAVVQLVQEFEDIIHPNPTSDLNNTLVNLIRTERVQILQVSDVIGRIYKNNNDFKKIKGCAFVTFNYLDETNTIIRKTEKVILK